MASNIVNLVKDMLPDAIRRTERDTFIYTLDGDEQVFPSYRTAAHALGNALGLGKRHVPTEEFEKRLGAVKVVYTSPTFDARNMRTPPPATRPQGGGEQSTDQPLVRSSRTPRTRTAKVQRSVRVTIPQSAMSELLRSGRVRILLAVK